MDESLQFDLNLFRILMNVSRTLGNNAKKDLAELGIEPHHFIILRFLYSNGPHPIQKISDMSCVPIGSITYVVDKLENQGYVERKESPGDRRTTLATITSKGSAFFESILPGHAQCIAQHFTTLSDEEKHTLMKLLNKMEVN